MNTDPELESLMAQLGDFGSYQLRQHCLLALAAFLAGMQMFSLVAVAPTPLHRCFIDEIDGNVDFPSFDKAILSQYIPLKDGELHSCKMFDRRANNTISCGGNFVYDKTYYVDSKVITWDLVCENRWKRETIQSVYMFGVFAGAIILGPLADKCGRKTIFYICALAELAFTLAVAFIDNYIAYCVGQFFCGMFGPGGAYIVSFVLTLELVGASKRTLCGTVFSIMFAIGVMFVALWGYLIQRAMFLQMTYALHGIVLIGHWWLIDESIRWLWGQNRKEEAIKIIKNGCKVNGVEYHSNYETPSTLDDTRKSEKLVSETKSHGVVDLFRTPRLRSRTMNVALNWFANSLVYYGLSLSSGSLVGDPYANLFLIGLAELPGYFTVVALLDRCGRRSLCSVLMLLGGFSCVIIAFIPAGISRYLVLFAKMAIAGSFAIIYNYTAELFPTVVRNSAIGVGSMSARISGMLTPFLGLLDTVDKDLPSIVFGSVAIISAFFTFFLPETLRRDMPQTIEDGERFGVGDTAFKTCSQNISKKTLRLNRRKSEIQVIT